MKAPEMLLTLQSATFYYNYSNKAAERAAALPEEASDSKTPTYHPLFGLRGQTSEQLPPELVSPPRLPSPEADVKAESQSPPRSASPTRMDTTALNSVPANGEAGEEVAVTEGISMEAEPPPPSEAQLLVKEIKEDMIRVRAQQGRRRQETEMRDEWELARMKKGLEGEMQRRLEPAKELVQHPTGDWIGVCRLCALESERTSSGLRWKEIGGVHPKQGRQLTNTKLAGELMRTTGLRWTFAGATPPPSGRDLENSSLSDALMHKTDFTPQEWEEFGVSHARMDDYVKSGESYFKPQSRKTEFTQKEWDLIGVSDLRTDDFIKCGNLYFQPDGPTEKLGEKLKGVETSALTEELAAEIAALQRQADYLQAQDIFVEVMTVPSGNEGALTLPRGVSIPGTYVLKYFTESSPLPLAVSDRFIVDFPNIGITAPAEVEIGRTFKLVS